MNIIATFTVTWFALIFELAAADTTQSHPQVPSRSDISLVVRTDPNFVESIDLAGKLAPFASEVMNGKWGGLITKVHVRVGDRVKKGQIIAETDQTYTRLNKGFLLQNLQMSNSMLKMAQLQVKRLSSEKAKLLRLIKLGVESRTRLDELEERLIQEQVNLMGAEDGIEQLKQYLADTEDQIRKADYYASIDGVVTEMAVSPEQIFGAFFANNDTVVARIDQPGEYLVKCRALDVQVPHLREGMSASIEVAGIERRFAGTVESIGVNREALKDGNTFFDVAFRFKSDGIALPREVLATATVATSVRKNVVAIPWNAVNLDAGEASVRVSSSAGRSLRKVKISARNAQRVVVERGLKEGEVVEGVLY